MSFRTWLIVIALAAIGAAAYFAIPRWEGEPPVVSGLADSTLGQEPREIEIRLSDAGAGLRSLELRVMSAGGSKTLLSRTFPGSLAEGGTVADEVVTLQLDAAKLELPDGPATLTAVVTDWSLRSGFDGNRGEATATLTVDTAPPRVAATSGLTYVYRGGSAAVAYTVGADATRHGVRVGDAYFPGVASAGSDSEKVAIAIFGVPVDAPPEPLIRIVASDEAGNERAADFPARMFERSFEKRELALSPRFLAQRALPLARANGFEPADSVTAFRDVNEKLRARSEQRIREAIGDTPSARAFEGGFEQMRGSQVTSRFAEERHYTVDGREISVATHYGFDLASTAGAAITSANAGVVVLAEDLGIYGNCVIVDHGLGVHSLYAHLSSIGVATGDRVAKGQTLGRSGMTGLAGGDHLHFAILVGGAYVDPMEWWDTKWVRSHVEVRLPGAER